MHSPNVRESRHVLVTGLPADATTAQEIDNFFSNFGKLEKEAVRCPDGVIISFRDIRSAQKALQSDQRLKNLNYQMSYHEANTAAKNPISNSCMEKRGSPASPQPQEVAPTPTSSRRRSVSPWREKFDQLQLEKKLKSRTKRPLNNSITNRRKEARSPQSPTLPEGLQGYYIEKLPKGDHNVLKRQLTDQFKSNGSIADILVEEINGNNTRALLVFNEVKVTPEKYEMFGTTARCRVRPAEPVDVQIAYSKTVARKAGIAISMARERDLPANLQDEFTVFSDRASRTLYVGGLETNPTEQSLRRRFDRFGTILEVDVKNPESPSPFAFIHFVDMDSTVKAVNHHLQHGGTANTTAGFGKKQSKVNFGRTNVSKQLWLGCIPSSVPEDAVKSKLKAMLDGSTDVLYDIAANQALVRFGSPDSAQKGYTGVRSQNIEFEYDGQIYRLSVDYGTEALLNYFRERLGKGNYLSPPPNPPADMPGYSRYDDRKGSSRRRSRSRDRGRRSRSGSRRRNRRRSTRRRTRSTSEDSSASSGPSSSNGSRSSSPSRSDSPPHRYRHSVSKKRTPGRNDDYGNHHGDRSPKRSYSRERRKSVPSLSKHADSHHHHHQQSSSGGDRAASGDSGFEEPRQLEPPPAPPPLAPPIQHKASPPPAPPPGPPPPPLPKQPPPSQHFYHMPSGHQALPPPRPQPPPLMAQSVAPPPLMTLPPPLKSHRPREDHHHIPYPGPSNERDRQRQPDRRDDRREERKESIIRHQDHYPERMRDDRREDRPREDRSRDDRQRDDRRDERPRDDRPREERPRDDRPRDDRPREDRSRDERPRDDKPRERPPMPPLDIRRPPHEQERPRPHEPERRPHEPERRPPPHEQDRRPPLHEQGRPLHEQDRRMTHEQLVKKPSVDLANPPPPPKHIPKNPREHGLKDPRVFRRPDFVPRPVMTQIGRFSCIYGTWEIRKTPVMEARMIKEPPSNVETGPVHPEARKRSSGSVHSVDHNKGDGRSDARRASGGNVPQSHDDPHTAFHSFPSFGQLPAPAPPTPVQPFPPTSLFGVDENARLKQRSESAPNWQNQKSLEPQTPQTPAPFSAGPGPTPGPGLIQSRTGSISYEDRLSKLRQLGAAVKHTPIKLGLNPISTQQFGMSGGNLPPPPLPSSSRPNLHITIPAAGTSFPTTPNSAKSDFSPRVDNARKLNTAIPTSSSRQPFAPVSAQLPSLFDQHPSPLLNAPPPPPVLPKLDGYLKSPPMTPSASRLPQTVSTPSPSISGRPTDFKQQTPQTPSTPRSAHPSSRPSMDRRDSERRGEFGVVNPWDKTKEKPQPQQLSHRHDSLSFMRSPPVPPKKTSLPPLHEPQPISTPTFPPSWGSNAVKPREPPKELPFGRIPKKSSAAQLAIPMSPLVPPKAKEHKKHKEHKARMKSDGTLETREERKMRKAMSKERKDKTKKIEKKLEKKKSKDRDSKEKEKDKDKDKDKERRREREREREREHKKDKDKDKDKDKKDKKKKKKKHRPSSDDDSDVDDPLYLQKQVMRDQSEQMSADAKLAAMISVDMYDRVKRRSSGVTKDESKKKALQALKDKNHPKKKRLLVSSDDDEDDSSAESDAKKTDSEPELDEETLKLKVKPSLEKDLHLTSESDSEEEVPPKKTKIEKGKTSHVFVNDDLYVANSSEDEKAQLPNERKAKTSVSDESDHHRKHPQKTDYYSLFGSDSVDEKKEKKKSQSPAQQKQRKRLPSSTHEDNQAKRSKRGSLSSEVSGEAKSREQSVKKEDPMTSGSEDKHPIHPQEIERPRLLTKAAMKVFETPSTSHQPHMQQQHQLSDHDTDDSDEAGPAESQNLSSTSGSESEGSGSPLSPSRSTVHELEEQLHDDGQSTVATTEPNEQSQDAPLEQTLLPAPPPPPPPHFPSSSPAVQYEFQELVEEEPVRDLEGDLAAQAICDDDDQNFEPVAGQATIFDDCVDPIPEYPSHAFTRDEPIIVDPNPVEISEEQILMESFAEEPLPEDEENAEMNPSHPKHHHHHPPVPLKTSTPRANQENEFPSPSSLAAHAVAVKSPLSVAVDGPQQQQQPVQVRTPQLFSPVATSSSNDGLTSPIRSKPTPMSAVAQSPLVSPGMASATPPLRMDMMRNADFTQNLMGHQNLYHTRQQFENSFYQNNIRNSMAQQQMQHQQQQQHHQQVPLQQIAPVQQSPVPVPHLNGLASSSVILEHRGLAAVPSPSHQHSGNSSLSSPGTPPSFGKEEEPPILSIIFLLERRMSSPADLHIPRPPPPPASLLPEQFHHLAGIEPHNLQQFVNAVTLQSIVTQQSNNFILKAMLSNIFAQQQQQPLDPAVALANIQNLVNFQQQYQALARGLNIAQEPAENTRKRQMREDPPAVPAKKPCEQRNQLMEKFDIRLDQILKEEFDGREKENSEKEYTLKDILDLNMDKELKGTSSSSSPRLMSITPPGGSPSEYSAAAPLSPGLLDRIRNVALSMRGDAPADTFDLEKMPPVWKGRIIIKNAAEATVQMHYMFGQKDYLNMAMATLDKLEKDPSLRIGQRMKAEGDGLYRLLHRLQELGTTCLCVPVGNNPEEVQQHARILKTEFADYFIKRGCAGVIPLEISPKSFLYVFPPNEFTDQFLQSASPDLFSRIQNKLTEQFSYLFVAIAPATED